jgi:hypothetical protein
VVTIVREDNKVVGETLIAAQAGSRQLLGAAALPSLYDDSYPRLGCSGRCGGDHSRNGDLDAGLPLVSGVSIGIGRGGCRRPVSLALAAPPSEMTTWKTSGRWD